MNSDSAGRFSLRSLFALTAVVAVILAQPLMIAPTILGCWLLALWRRTRTPYLIGASIVALPAWVVAINFYPAPRSLAPLGENAPADVVAERRAFEREQWREYQPGMRICVMWVMGAMLAGGALASVSQLKRASTP